jgi:hypothetical protein
MSQYSIGEQCKSGSSIDRSCHFDFPACSIYEQASKPGEHSEASLKTTTQFFVPETDVRETKQAYHIDIALAGLSDTNSLAIEWFRPRVLVVQGELQRHFVGCGEDARGQRLWDDEADDILVLESHGIAKVLYHNCSMSSQKLIDL